MRLFNLFMLGNVVMLPLRGTRSSLSADNSLSSVTLKIIALFGGSLAFTTRVDVDAHEEVARHTKCALRDAEFSAFSNRTSKHQYASAKEGYDAAACIM